ncbi:TetR/AcrR family transcriptional regulator C-terminal domain-containing protein [Amycolatopsis nigrescens]|uniref:TetR/AcrR family transcriptional regulator C-terminal domain-containing protein n=1 Tax=Amycolatopsis nigrescens TaxID=381445 RepID=UPI00038077E4|nr:TetR/AcrR family transcriptional regulator C-terminal domain-containing protein [Amycolatopsis nigrescens]
MDTPPYARIVTEIRHRIATGELRAGDRVPSTRQLIQDWGVAMATATKALSTLRQEGLVRAVRGVGTVVADPSERPVPAREPRAGDLELNRERVVLAAVAVADTEGLPALSMRRVATELDVATMSLYRHVRNKDELVLLMADAVLRENALPAEPPPQWRAGLEITLRAQWATYRSHPWLAQVLSVTRPQVLPALLAHTEWTLRVLHGHGLDQGTMLYAHITAFSYVRGIAVNLAPEAEAEQDTGMTYDEWMSAEGEPALAALVGPGSFPVFQEIAAGGEFDLDLDRLFEFGLTRLLDGFAALLEPA